MILTLFILLLGLSIVLVGLGYFTADGPFVPVGLFFIFLLSIVILNKGLEYQTGEQMNVSFSYSNGSVSRQVVDTTYYYGTWNDTTSRWVGYLMAICAGFGFAISLANLRRKDRD